MKQAPYPPPDDGGSTCTARPAQGLLAQVNQQVHQVVHHNFVRDELASGSPTPSGLVRRPLRPDSPALPPSSRQATSPLRTAPKQPQHGLSG